MWQHCSIHWNQSTKWNHPSPPHSSISLAFMHFSIFKYYSITSSSAIMITQELCISYNNSLCRSKAIFINLFIWLLGFRDGWGLEHLLCEEVGMFSLEKRWFQVDLTASPRYLWGGYQQNGKKSFSVVHDGRMTAVVIKWELLTLNMEI